MGLRPQIGQSNQIRSDQIRSAQVRSDQIRQVHNLPVQQAGIGQVAATTHFFPQNSKTAVQRRIAAVTLQLVKHHIIQRDMHWVLLQLS